MVIARGANWNKFYAFLIILIATLVSFFFPHELGGEEWIYWFWARVFKETGRFIILDRSPLYILYLNLFNWMQYPFSVIVEHLVTSIIGVVSLILLFKQYTKLRWAVFASLIWLPFLQTAEPKVQFLALSCTCLAMVIRITKKGRFWNALFYTFLIMAYLFRTSYLVLIIIFIIWDLYIIFKQEKGNLKKITIKLKPKISDWPIFAIFVLIIFFVVFQSSNTWNNSWGATNTWFPADGTSAVNAGFIHQFNEAYITQTNVAFEGNDFYFTNQNIFKGANNVVDAFLANPQFVFKQIIRNYAELPAHLSLLTALSVTAFSPKIVNVVKKSLIPNSKSLLPRQIIILIISAIICLFFALSFLYGVFRACKNLSMVVFVVGTLIIVLMLLILTTVRTRYLVPLVPIFILGAIYFGDKYSQFFKKKSWKFLSFIAMPLFLILFSNIILMAGTMVGELDFNNFKILESPNNSLKATYFEINNLIINCRGVMASENKFVGAFMDIPLENVYDIWEIPPFGYYNNSTYKSLRLDRIDCLLISNGLILPVVGPTNGYIRYKNYLEPYSKYLRDNGAKTYEIPRYGTIIIYKSPQNASEQAIINYLACSTYRQLGVMEAVRCTPGN